VGAENDRDFTLTNKPGGSGSSGGTAPVSGVFFFTSDGTTTAAQLLDTAGDAVTSGFTVTDIKRNGTVVPSANYSISASGIVTWVTAPTAGGTYTWDGTVTLFPDGYFVPGVVHWLTGANAGRENEVESYDQGTGAVVLVIPTRAPIQAGDTLEIRRDCDKSKTMCIAYGNLLNMRAEPELPRADGTDLMSPSTVAPS
jgi:hypothetical protein